jgi:poly-gamma-glutamate synthesis protein (capsule biosynthesis protein)
MRSLLLAAALLASCGFPAGSERASSQSRPLLVVAVGDVLLSGKVGELIARRGPEAPLAAVAGELRRGDVTIGNLECPLASGGRRAEKTYTFLARPASAQALATAGINVVSLANNHSGDYGRRALLETMRVLSEAGVGFVGAGSDLRRARQALHLGLARRKPRVALLAYSNMLPTSFYATAARPGTNPAVEDNIRADVTAARARADLVIVSFHWGKERASRPTAGQKRLGRLAIDAGADLVLGHHAHVLQGIERYQGRFIAYSLGNFLFPSRGQCRESVILTWSFSPGGRAGLELIPVFIEGGLPRLAKGEKARAIAQRLAALSRELGLKLEIRGDRARARTGLTAGKGD